MGQIHKKIEELIIDAMHDYASSVSVKVDHSWTAGLTHPQEESHGDYASNIAMRYATHFQVQPRELAARVVAYMEQNKPDEVAQITVEGPGFINFVLRDKYFFEQVQHLIAIGDSYGKNELCAAQKIMVEYTDPNPFKQLHIGHLMSNAIGEALSRLLAFSGAEVKRANYQGDVGMHVAKAVWGMQHIDEPNIEENAPIAEKAAYLGRAYAYGATAYEENEDAKLQMNEMNAKIFQRSDDEINSLYDMGRAWSLAYFEEQYKKLGTKFDYYFFESKTGVIGQELVMAHLADGIFEESDGAIVFKGEKYDLHTRVFINAQGLPTYEAKELGLSKIKYDMYPYDQSIVVTGNEIREYFKVILKVMSLIYPDLAQKTTHISHGMLRLTSGKMSSRTGDVITAESLIEDVTAIIEEKMKDAPLPESEKNTVATQVAVGAIKYSMLRQDIGKDIVFDFDTSLSFTGDSGPYLQYTHARCRSLLRKADEAGIVAENLAFSDDLAVGYLERLLARYPEAVQSAATQLSPHILCTYLHMLAQAFNAYYAQHTIVDTEDASSAYRVAITLAVATVMQSGLAVLGIVAPERM